MKYIPLLIIVILILSIGIWSFSMPLEAPVSQDGDTKGVTTLVAHTNERVEGGNVSITPLEVIEDSRCPVDVQCIWEGAVKLKARLASGLGEGDMVFVLNTPITTEVEEVILTNVAPAARAGITIKQDEYRFTFSVKKRPNQ